MIPVGGAAGHTGRRNGLLLALLLLLLAVAVAGTVLAEIAIAANPHSTTGDVAYALTAVTTSAAAIIVLGRRRRLVIGWLMLGIGAVTGFEAAVNALANLAYQRSGDLPIAELAGWQSTGPLLARLADVFWIPGVFGFVALFVVFPDGRPPTPAFRWVIRADAASCLLVASVILTDASGSDFPHWNGRPVHVPVLSVLAGHDSVLAVLQLGAILGSVAAVVVRTRRADPVTRQQLKVIAWFGLVFAVTVIPGIPLDAIPNASLFWVGVADVSSNVVIGSFPVAVAVAVTRYRLFEIDRLLSRTVSYALLSGVVAGVFVGVVLLVGQLGLGSNWAVAAATLLSVAALTPLRRRLQDLVDRRFDRARIDGRRTADGFAQRLRDQVDLDAVRTDLLTTVGTSLAPAGATVWLLRDRP